MTYAEFMLRLRASAIRRLRQREAFVLAQATQDDTTLQLVISDLENAAHG